MSRKAAWSSLTKTGLKVDAIIDKISADIFVKEFLMKQNHCKR